MPDHTSLSWTLWTSGMPAGAAPGDATREQTIRATTGKRRLDLGVHDLKTDIEVGHRIPDRARADLPGIPVGAARVKPRAAQMIVSTALLLASYDVYEPQIEERSELVQ